MQNPVERQVHWIEIVGPTAIQSSSGLAEIQLSGVTATKFSKFELERES